MYMFCLDTWRWLTYLTLLGLYHCVLKKLDQNQIREVWQTCLVVRIDTLYVVGGEGRTRVGRHKVLGKGRRSHKSWLFCLHFPGWCLEERHTSAGTQRGWEDLASIQLEQGWNAVYTRYKNSTHTVIIILIRVSLTKPPHDRYYGKIACTYVHVRMYVTDSVPKHCVVLLCCTALVTMPSCCCTAHHFFPLASLTCRSLWKSCRSLTESCRSLWEIETSDCPIRSQYWLQLYSKWNNGPKYSKNCTIYIHAGPVWNFNNVRSIKCKSYATSSANKLSNFFFIADQLVMYIQEITQPYIFWTYFS